MSLKDKKFSFDDNDHIELKNLSHLSGDTEVDKNG